MSRVSSLRNVPWRNGSLDLFKKSFTSIDPNEEDNRYKSSQLTYQRKFAFNKVVKWLGPIRLSLTYM